MKMFFKDDSKKSYSSRGLISMKILHFPLVDNVVEDLEDEISKLVDIRENQSVASDIIDDAPFLIDDHVYGEKYLCRWSLWIAGKLRGEIDFRYCWECSELQGIWDDQKGEPDEALQKSIVEAHREISSDVDPRLTCIYPTDFLSVEIRYNISSEYKGKTSDLGQLLAGILGRRCEKIKER